MPIIKTYTSNEEAYRELRNAEYLQSSGTQYINTGVKANSELITKSHIRNNNNTSSSNYISGGDGWQNKYLQVEVTNVNIIFAYGTQNYSGLSTTAYANKKIYLEQNKNNLYIDGELLISKTYQEWSSNYEIRLFAYNRGGSIGEYGKYSLYDLKIYNNTTLVRDFQPVVMNGVGYLYDKVEHKLYGNDGTGSFTYGSILDITINPLNSGWVDRDIIDGKLSLNAIANSGYEFVNWLLKGYTQLEYIESTGTQWIDTQLNFNLGQKFDFKLRQLVNTSGVYGIFGENASTPLEVLLAYSDLSRNWLNDEFSYTWELNRDYDVVLDLANTSNKLKCFVNNTLIRDTSGNVANNPIYLFAIYSSGVKPTSQRYYHCKIYDTNGLVRNYIPVIRHSDGAIGLLDLCEMKFYGNSGTGEFVAGPTYEGVN